MNETSSSVFVIQGHHYPDEIYHLGSSYVLLFIFLFLVLRWLSDNQFLPNILSSDGNGFGSHWEQLLIFSLFSYCLHLLGFWPYLHKDNLIGELERSLIVLQQPVYSFASEVFTSNTKYFLFFLLLSIILFEDCFFFSFLSYFYRGHFEHIFF